MLNHWILDSSTVHQYHIFVMNRPWSVAKGSGHQNHNVKKKTYRTWFQERVTRLRPWASTWCLTICKFFFLSFFWTARLFPLVNLRYRPTAKGLMRRSQWFLASLKRHVLWGRGSWFMPLAIVTTKIPNLNDLVGFVGYMRKVSRWDPEKNFSALFSTSFTI